MPYQRSTQAKGFTKRAVYDESKQLRQYSKDLDKQRKTDVQAWERQDALWEKEAKDTYEIANLSNFSKTLNKMLQTVAEDVVKPINEGQVDDGVEDGIAAAQGDKEALKKIALQEEQILEIENKVAEQRKTVLEKANNVEKTWDGTNYKASLEEKYRLLNLKKLGGNHAYGYRIGYLMQSASGYDAWRDSILTPNSEHALSQQVLPGTDLIIGNYRSYNTEEKKSILAYVQKQYILTKGSGMKSSIVDKYLTRPVLEKTAKFQNTEYEVELANWATETETDLNSRFQNALEGIDQNTDALKTSIEEIAFTYPSISKALNLPGSHNLNTKKKILELIKSEVSTLKVGRHANVDDQEDFIIFARTVPIVIPGITPEGGSPLFEIWSTELNEAGLRLDLLAASADKIRKHKTSQNLLATGEWQTAFAGYREDGNFANYDAQLKLIKETYGAYITPQMLANWQGAIDQAIMPIEQAESYLANDIFKDKNTVLFVGDPALRKVPQKLINEYIKKEKILTKVYQFPTDKAVHMSSANSLTSNTIQLLKQQTDGSDIKFDKNHPQIIAFNSHVTSKLHKLAWEIYDQSKGDEGGITLAQAFSQATEQISLEIQDGQNKPNTLYYIHPEIGFTHGSLNSAHLGDKEILDLGAEQELQKELVNNALNISRDNTGTNVWLAPEIPVIIDNPKFYQLNNNGGVHLIWDGLSEQTGIPAEILYNWQANKLDPALGIQPKVWSQPIQDKLNLWKTTNPNDWADLNSGDSLRVGRALDKRNVVDLAALARAVVSNDGSLPISEGEYKSLLESLGLDSSISYEEFLSKPELVNQVFNKKALNIIDQVETMTSNPREGLRMVLAGLKFGDVNEYQSADAYTLYTIYKTDDRDLIAKLNSGFNMDSRYIRSNTVFETDKYFGNNTDINSLNSIEAIDTELNNLGEPPSKLVITERDIPVSAGPVTNMIGGWIGLDKKTEPNPEYLRYEKRKQLLNDKKLIFERITQGDLIFPRDWNRAKKYGSSEIFDALNRVLGDRVPALIKKANELPGNAEQNYLQLIMAEPEFVEFVNPNAYIPNQPGDQTSTELSAYEPGGVLIGNIGKQDLTPVEGHYGSKINVRNDVADKLIQLKDAATKEGYFLAFTSKNSGYRTTKQQTELYNQKKRGGLPGTPQVATPGTSEHESGKAVDFDLNAMANQQPFTEKAIRVMMRELSKKTGGKLGSVARQQALDKLRKDWEKKTITWLEKNAHKYGFKQTVKGEPWHWVYDASLLNTGDVN